MNLNKIKITLFCFILLLNLSVVAQQDEQSSLYMFNPLQYNPAFAGSRGYLNASLVSRSQWVGLSGAPRSQFLSINSPLPFKNMAGGAHISNDVLGAKNRTSFYGDYAYTLNFNKGRRLNFGMSLGAEQIVVDYASLLAIDPSETELLTSFSQFKFNSGLGAYYYGDKFYLGFSVPRVFQSSLKNNSVVFVNTFIKRHYFLTGGYVFPINSVVDLKTSFLVKATANAPVTVDLNANVFLYKSFWAGLMYRYNESIGANIAYQYKEYLMFGYSFDYPVNDLVMVKNATSHEVMLTYSIHTKKNAFGSPRYF